MTTNINMNELINDGNTILKGFRRLKVEAPADSEAIRALHEALIEDFKQTKRVYPLNLSTLQIIDKEASKMIYHVSKGIAGGYGPTVYRNYERYLKNAGGNVTTADAVNAVKDAFRAMSNTLTIAGFNIPILANSTIKALLKEHVKGDSRRVEATADVKHFSNELAKALMLKLYGINYKYTNYDDIATAKESENAKKEAERAKKRATAKKVSEAKKNGTNIKDGNTIVKVKVTA